MQAARFDDSNIPWRSLEGFEGVEFHICFLDEGLKAVDVIYKFQPGVRQPLHRHRCPYFTLVLQGELRFWRPDGELKETRRVGSYVAAQANGKPHVEGAGEEEAIVFFGHRDIDDALYEFLDADGRTTQTLGMEDFKALLAERKA